MKISEGDKFIERGVPFTEYTEYRIDSNGFREPYADRWHIGPFDECCDECNLGHMMLTVHEIIITEKSGILVVYYRAFYNPDGEQNAKPKRKVTSLGALKSFIRQYKLEKLEE